MKPRARHPEVVALALIVLLLGAGAGPGRVLTPLDGCDCKAAEVASRVLEKAVEIELRLVERLVDIGERLASHLALPAFSLPRLR